MDEKRRTPQPRKKPPLMQRAAHSIVQKIDQNEKNKQQKAREKAAAQRQPRPAQQGPAQQRPAQQRSTQQRPAQDRPVRQRPATSGARPEGNRQRKPLTPEQRARRAAYMRRIKKRRRIIRIAIAVIAALLVMLILSRTVLFKIQSIEVTNPKDANYTVEQIVTASGVTFGAQNLFTCDLKKTGKNIEQYLPYIGSAQVERDFPNALQVTVKPTKASAAIALGAGYLLIDKDGKMLENTETAPEIIPVLRCKTEFVQTLGQYIGVPASGRKADDETKKAAQMIALYKKVYAALNEAKITDVTLIDIRDTRAITLMYQNRLTLHLGSEDLLEQKLKTAAKTIAAESDASRTRTGAIDLTNVPYAYARDTYERPEGESVTDVSEPESTTEAG
ncbi:MAG: FtsQ-type POTRA domain-containing protein [Clostridia bacterium]|nr:FtsQ-type POTRA domain-containing protein [Clostridia bacterium]